MVRVPYLDVDKHPELDKVAAEIRAQRGGQVSNLYKVLLYCPKIAEGWLNLNTAVRTETKLSLADQELAILLIAIINKAHFEVKSHAPKALAEGMTQAQIDAMANWRECKEFSPRQRAILAYVDAMTRNVEVPDPVFEGIRAIYNEQSVVELTFLVASYNLVTRFTVALNLTP